MDSSKDRFEEMQPIIEFGRIYLNEEIELLQLRLGLDKDNDGGDDDDDCIENCL